MLVVSHYGDITLSKGKELAKALSLKVEQALYSDWGNFYAAITRYPCALFDRNGYIIVWSEEDLERNGIKVGKRTNVPRKISSLPAYVLTKAILARAPDEISETEYVEGSVTKITVNRYERDRSARKACLDHYGYACSCCGIKLEEVYGEIAKGFIHVHHIKPISEIKEEYRLDPIKDLRPVCPNCHSIIHLSQPPMSISELKRVIKENKNG